MQRGLRRGRWEPPISLTGAWPCRWTTFCWRPRKRWTRAADYLREGVPRHPHGAGLGRPGGPHQGGLLRLADGPAAAGQHLHARPLADRHQALRPRQPEGHREGHPGQRPGHHPDDRRQGHPPEPAAAEQRSGASNSPARSRRWPRPARVAIRNARRDGNKQIDKEEKESILTEDDAEKGRQDVQKLTDDYEAKVTALLEAKTKEIREI